MNNDDLLFTGLSLCSGGGGLELGIERVLGNAYYCVGYCERDCYPAAALVARMAEKALRQAPICALLDDIDGEAWHSTVDILSAGFPCQPWSSAGEHRGTADERWIWPDIARIIRDVRPSIVFLENTPGLTLGGIEHVLGDLALCGLDAEWDCFCADEIGAPHERERIFILAWDVSDASRIILRLAAERDLLRKTNGGNAKSRDVGEELADTGSRGGSSRHARRKSKAATRKPKSIERGGKLADSERVRQQGQPPPRVHGGRPSGDDALRPSHRTSFEFPPGATDLDAWRDYIARGGPEPAIRRSPDGMAGQLDFRVDRIRVCGNGAVPQQVEKAFRTLAERALT